MREAIVTEARSWIGTPYHTHAGVKGVGVDCGMLLVRVYTTVGLLPEGTDLPNYAPDWYLHEQSSGWVEDYLSSFTHEVDTVDLGDILLFKYGRAYSHGCIVTCLNPVMVIHAYAPLRCVIEEELTLNTELVNRLSSVKKRAILGV